MSRKIFVIVNVVGGARIPVMSGGSTVLGRADSNHVCINPEELYALDATLNINGYDRAERQYDSSHYFKRRAQARRAVAAMRESWPEADLRVHEVGKYERNVRPIKQWQLTGALSIDKGKTFGPYQHFSYRPLREQARAAKAKELSEQVRYETEYPLSVVRWKFKVVPVYAD